MATAKDQFIDDVRTYIDAGERLIEGMRAFNEMNVAALDDLERGMTVTESFAKWDSAGWSRRVNSLLEGFEDCRRADPGVRRVALVAEGHSASSVADAFGHDPTVGQSTPEVRPCGAGVEWSRRGLVLSDLRPDPGR